MKTSKYLARYLSVATLLLLLSCGSPDKIERQLLGMWEGGSIATDFSWCVHYQAEGYLELATHQKLITPGDPPKISPQITKYQGDWTLRTGNRLRHNLLAKAKYREGKNLLADQADGEYHTADYIIAHADKHSMKYRWLALVDGEEKWFESMRVESCSEKFNPEKQ